MADLKYGQEYKIKIIIKIVVFILYLFFYILKMVKKVIVNQNCIWCWACVAICPEVFSISDEWTAEVIWNVNCEDMDCITDAKSTCPVEAIECIEWD